MGVLRERVKAEDDMIETVQVWQAAESDRGVFWGSGTGKMGGLVDFCRLGVTVKGSGTSLSEHDSEKSKGYRHQDAFIEGSSQFLHSQMIERTFGSSAHPPDYHMSYVKAVAIDGHRQHAVRLDTAHMFQHNNMHNGRLEDSASNSVAVVRDASSISTQSSTQVFDINPMSELTTAQINEIQARAQTVADLDQKLFDIEKRVINMRQRPETSAFLSRMSGTNATKRKSSALGAGHAEAERTSTSKFLSHPIKQACKKILASKNVALSRHKTIIEKLERRIAYLQAQIVDNNALLRENEWIMGTLESEIDGLQRELEAMSMADRSGSVFERARARKMRLSRGNSCTVPRLQKLDSCTKRSRSVKRRFKRQNLYGYLCRAEGYDN